MSIAIIGAGPAGLMAAENAAAQGFSVVIYERMPSPARKFLMAGRGGLNLTHSEDLPRFLARYDDGAAAIRAAIEKFPSQALRAWADALGQDTFIGSSGRVFPRAMKASPLLRAWLRRLDDLGVRIETRCDWRGWDEQGGLLIARGDEIEAVAADATILACGGASWPRLGSDGSWATTLERERIAVTPLRPSNMGVVIPWSNVFAQKFAGSPVKRVALSIGDRRARGEVIVTKGGLEGGAIYPLSGALRAAIDRDGAARLVVDLRADIDEPALADRLSRGRAKDSLSTRLKRSADLTPVAVGLLREATSNAPPSSAAELARLIKALPFSVSRTADLSRAISTAGGIRLDALDDRFMLKARPGVFAAGEMLDWDAPTGGYLLQACFATGRAAAQGAMDWLATRAAPTS